MIVHVDDKYSHIECDVKGCGEKSPPADVMLKNHGLAAMGWNIQPGFHKCPAHFYEHAEPQGPQRRTKRQQAALDRKRNDPVA